MEDLRSLALIVVIAPLAGAIISGIGGKHIGRTATHWLTSSLVGVSFLISSYLLYGFVTGKFFVWDHNIYTWASMSDLTISVGFLLDQLSTLMITVVTFISLMVHIYSIGYMRDDPGYHRFFSYISLFTFAMLMLVMSNNFMQLFFGWEAVGLVSYLLIGFWFKKPSANFASLKAFLVNRVGDLGFILGIAGVLMYTGALEYNIVFKNLANLIGQKQTLNYICLALFIGAMAKSAQIPLHVWLPDSMEGPTPISALIHAATMVTAGIFMVARLEPLFMMAPDILAFITIIGALTCFFMGILGVVQRDIKRIIAYSTLSQLGYMVVALGVSAYSISIFHLVTHAFFKALLFLGAGSVIIALHHQQDIFQMGNLRKYMPITFSCMLIGTLALIGFPGTAGFYSKDLIIEAVRGSMGYGSTLAYWAVLISVFFTALYSFRLLFVVFFGPSRAQHAHLHESARVIWIPLVLLAIPSVFLGALMVRSIAGVSPWEMLIHGFVQAPFVLAVLGFITAWLCYVKFPTIPALLQYHTGILPRILAAKYGFDALYENILTPVIRKLGDKLWRYGDMCWIDGMLVNGSARSINFVANMLHKLQTGYLYNYIFAMLFGLLILLFMLL